MKARIKAIESHLPAGTLSNEELAREFGNWDAGKIYEKTGIRNRHIAATDECASDLAVCAAKKLFAGGACHASQIDFVLFCTQSPDFLLPTTACTLQQRLGLPTDCGAIDINQGCSGFVYGLALAASLVEAGTASNVLLITAETYSKYINRMDRSARTIFGDGAAATLISAADSDERFVGPFVLGTDGTGEWELIVPVGGARSRKSPETGIETEAEGGNRRSPENLYMNGPEIFSFSLREVPRVVQQLLHKSGKTREQVDYFVFHQANGFMLERLRAKIAIPADKFCVDLEYCGNTVSSTIPIALERALAKGKILPGHDVMLVGFGVGYSWAACMVRFAA